MRKRPVSELWDELEEIGEPGVRERLALNAYGDVGGKRRLVEEWLRQQEASRSDTAESRKQTMQTIAAIAAIVAAIAATIGAIASIIVLLSSQE